MAETKNNVLKFSRVKGADNLIRIENLDLSILDKALAMNANSLTACEDNKEVFSIVDTKNESLLSDVALEVNKNAVQDNTLVVKVVSDCYIHTVVRAVKYIDALYKTAQTAATEYDNAFNQLEEI